MARRRSLRRNPVLKFNGARAKRIRFSFSSTSSQPFPFARPAVISSFYPALLKARLRAFRCKWRQAAFLL